MLNARVNATSIIVALLLSLAAGVALWLGLRRNRERFARQRVELERAAAAQRELVREQAIAQERERIYRDLHDDLGARLLDLVYRAPSAELAEQARSALQQLRAIVASARRTPAMLHDLLDELRIEARQRLATAGAELVWEQADSLPNPLLDQGRTLQLQRIVREALTNALRHARPARVRIRAFALGAELMIDLTDDGTYDPAALGSGGGSESMQHRAEQVGGRIHWQAGTWGGTKFQLCVPLADDDARA
jgi:signal transduction histidine kinase